MLPWFETSLVAVEDIAVEDLDTGCVVVGDAVELYGMGYEGRGNLFGGLSELKKKWAFGLFL